MAIAPQDASNTTDSTPAKGEGDWLPLIERAGDDSLGRGELIRMAKMAAAVHRAELGNQQAAAPSTQRGTDYARRIVTDLLRKEVDR